MPLANIVQALDDNGDGEADQDAWASVQQSAEDRISDAFGGSVPERYANAAAYARKVFLLETLFGRRGFSGDKNPFTSRANDAEKRLRLLSTGEKTPEGQGGGTIFSKDAKVANATGLMA